MLLYIQILDPKIEFVFDLVGRPLLSRAGAVVRGETLLIARLLVSAGRLGAAGALFNDVALIDGVLVVTLCQLHNG